MGIFLGNMNTPGTLLRIAPSWRLDRRSESKIRMNSNCLFGLFGGRRQRLHMRQIQLDQWLMGYQSRAYCDAHPSTDSEWEVGKPCLWSWLEVLKCKFGMVSVPVHFSLPQKERGKIQTSLISWSQRMWAKQCHKPSLKSPEVSGVSQKMGGLFLVLPHYPHNLLPIY